jgi:hypothetical protein
MHNMFFIKKKRNFVTRTYRDEGTKSKVYKPIKEDYNLRRLRTNPAHLTAALLLELNVQGPLVETRIVILRDRTTTCKWHISF